MKQEKGTCPCCRKEMTSIEDFPQANEEAEADSDDEDDDDDDDEDEDEETVEFSRERLDEFLRANGGSGLTDAMVEAICEETATFTEAELNFLCIGNGARNLRHDVWEELLIRDDLVEPTQLISGSDSEDDSDSEDESQASIRVHLDLNNQVGRTVSMRELRKERESAQKIQAAWRGYKIRSTLSEAQASVIITMLNR